MAPQTRTEPHSWWIYFKSFYCISTLTRPLWTILSGESDNCEIFILLLSSSSSRCCTLLFFPRFDFEKLFPLHHLLVLSISSRMLHDYYLAEMRYVHTFCFNHRLGISGGLYELLNPATWIVIALDDWLTDWMDGWMDAPPRTQGRGRESMWKSSFRFTLLINDDGQADRANRDSFCNNNNNNSFGKRPIAVAEVLLLNLFTFALTAL